MSLIRQGSRPSNASAVGGSSWSTHTAACTTATSCRPRKPSDKALALFSFPSLAAYEVYRALFSSDLNFIEADCIKDESGCMLRYERTFIRPLLPGYSVG